MQGFLSILDVKPTRMELNNMKNKLSVAVKGHRLLKNKSDGLFQAMINLKNQILNLKDEVFKALDNVFLKFNIAKVESNLNISNFLKIISNKTNVVFKINKKNVMGVKLPLIEFNKVNNSEQLNFLLQQNSVHFDESVALFLEIFPQLILLAQLEKSINVLNSELEKTRRRVNALEYLIIPNYEETIKFIGLKLEENERNNLSRLSKVNNKFLS